MGDSDSEPKICEPGGRGMIFPLVESEQEMDSITRAIIYALVMMYLFFGVNIVADKFMSSIEMITSSTKRIHVKGTTSRYITVKKWNPTVANITLMALGSSAPEILLSVVEMIRNQFTAGDLGPSTIVGSAAFNLFMIIAMCIVSIPSPEIREIKETGVFFITAIFSLLAYIWLVLIVQVTSPDVIEIWEGAVTLALFPILTFISYLADIGCFSRRGRAGRAPPVFTDSGTVHDSFKPIMDAKGNAIENDAGVFTFQSDYMEVSVGEESVEEIVHVFRCNGTKGCVSCKYRTVACKAVANRDFCPAEGELYFNSGESMKEFSVTLLRKAKWESDDYFQIQLEDCSGGAIFNPLDDGGEKCCILTVQLRNKNKDLLERNTSYKVRNFVDSHLNVDLCNVGWESWMSNVKDSICQVKEEEEVVEERRVEHMMKGRAVTYSEMVQGLADEQLTPSQLRAHWASLPLAPQGPSISDWFFHVIAVPWKLLFAVLIPPAELCYGWLCFVLSLAWIGAITAIIIDFAELFGCVTTLKDAVTAITFVALGTSMPDLFASVTSAAEDEYADASIVNVTGSNSVNVFLGIGIPWFMAAVYWQVTGATPKWIKDNAVFLQAHPEYRKTGAFVVLGGDLAFGVAVFSVAAIIGLGIIHGRRLVYGGELGGPKAAKWASGGSLACLWFFYIALATWKSYDQSAGFDRQLAVLLVGLYMVVVFMFLLGIFSKLAECITLVKGDADSEDGEASEQEQGHEDDKPMLEDKLSDLPQAELAIGVQDKLTRFKEKAVEEQTALMAARSETAQAAEISGAAANSYTKAAPVQASVPQRKDMLPAQTPHLSNGCASDAAAAAAPPTAAASSTTSAVQEAPHGTRAPALKPDSSQAAAAGVGAQSELAADRGVELKRGMRVRVVGTSRQDLNNRIAEVHGLYKEAESLGSEPYWKVIFEGGQGAALRRCNLEPVPSLPEALTGTPPAASVPAAASTASHAAAASRAAAAAATTVAPAVAQTVAGTGATTAAGTAAARVIPMATDTAAAAAAAAARAANGAAAPAATAVASAISVDAAMPGTTGVSGTPGSDTRAHVLHEAASSTQPAHSESQTASRMEQQTPPVVSAAAAAPVAEGRPAGAAARGISSGSPAPSTRLSGGGAAAAGHGTEKPADRPAAGTGEHEVQKPVHSIDITIPPGAPGTTIQVPLPTGSFVSVHVPSTAQVGEVRRLQIPCEAAEPSRAISAMLTPSAQAQSAAHAAQSMVQPAQPAAQRSVHPAAQPAAQPATQQAAQPAVKHAAQTDATSAALPSATPAATIAAEHTGVADASAVPASSSAAPPAAKPADLPARAAAAAGDTGAATAPASSTASLSSAGSSAAVPPASAPVAGTASGAAPVAVSSSAAAPVSSAGSRPADGSHTVAAGVLPKDSSHVRSAVPASAAAASSTAAPAEEPPRVEWV